tara:strand:- start:485 stop:1117 length:633 start_codon:yes stop_codon:yes gene_type:complete
MILEKQYFQSLSKVILLLCLALSAITSHAEKKLEQIIQEPINQLHETLINIMVISNSTSFEERYEYLEPIIDKNFDMELISKVVLGRFWKSINEEGKIKFIDLFKQLTISTYVSRFSSFNKQIFKNISITQLKENRFLVKTEFKKTEGKPISFNYIVQENNQKWRIISVIANGINDLSLKRAEYAAIIKKEGFDALVIRLKQKIQDSQDN